MDDSRTSELPTRPPCVVTGGRSEGGEGYRVLKGLRSVGKEGAMSPEVFTEEVHRRLRKQEQTDFGTRTPLPETPR